MTINPTSMSAITMDTYNQELSETKLFSNKLKAIKHQIDSHHHPLGKIINEFTKAFLYMNRHLLYIDKGKQRVKQPTRKDSSLIDQQMKKISSESLAFYPLSPSVKPDRPILSL